ncbi:ABC transporter permease [Paenibacillus sp. HN-1]|uniref:YhgE/Pip domain-containing protein n=1 Tax=Paenibacillus TaxID=44249 RepID=UPI001CA97BDD|nr:MULTISPECIES: ABC transporter permease [Paenibacillus]MBY9080369.1 ABC transporter permease [Paenibacillus sp. CGMCC 1.18879]MBY9082972.1 ABC transporter permease [Paenibacillus sinensis]
MTRTILLFLKHPLTLVGIITAILFQVFFSTIWITGYDHVTDRVNKLPVAIVNEDGAAAKPIADGIAASLTFETRYPMTLTAAREALENRQVRMIIVVPKGFSGSLADSASHPSITYYINASNPQMVSSAMGTAAGKITASLNEHVNEAMLDSLVKSLSLPEQPAGILKNSIAGRISSDVVTLHPVDNFAKLMVPLMFVTASFTGAMMLAMNLAKASASLAAKSGKWPRLAARFVITVGTAALVSLTGAGMTYGLGISAERGLLTLWAFEFVVILACMFVAQLSLFLLGDIGAWVNIALLSIQMLSSGATIPRDVLSPFYNSIGTVFPAYYAVDGIMNLVIGGPGLGRDYIGLALIGGAAAVLCILLTGLRREREAKPHPSAESAANIS